MTDNEVIAGALDWVNRMKDLMTSKTEKEDVEHISKHIEIVERLVEKVQQLEHDFIEARGVLENIADGCPIPEEVAKTYLAENV